MQRCIIRFKPWKTGYSIFPALSNKRKAPFSRLASFVFASVGTATLHYILFRPSRTYVRIPNKTQTPYKHLLYFWQIQQQCIVINAKKESITLLHLHDTLKISHYINVSPALHPVTILLPCNVFTANKPYCKSYAPSCFCKNLFMKYCCPFPVTSTVFVILILPSGFVTVRSLISNSFISMLRCVGIL